MAKLWAHVADPPPMPSTERPELVASFDETVAQATAKDPAERYPTAGDLATAVRRAVAEQEAKRQREAAQPTALAASEPSPVPAAAAPAEAAPAAGGGRPRRRRAAAVAALGLVCVAAVVATILLSTSSDSPSSTTATAVGRRARDERSRAGAVQQCPGHRRSGRATQRRRRDVSVKANGLLNAPHAMHFHAGTRGVCPPPRAARDHGGHLAISTSNGVPWYGPPVTALTTSGDTSPRRASSPSRASRAEPHRLPPAVPAAPGGGLLHPPQERRRDRAGIDYNRNGIYNFSALDRSELRPSLPPRPRRPRCAAARSGREEDRTGGGRAEDLHSFAAPRRRVRAGEPGRRPSVAVSPRRGDRGSADARVTRRATFLVVAVAAAGARWHSFSS